MAECEDGMDNDFDGLTDFPADPGCTNLTDDTESTVVECSDGLDNDADGFEDFPDDPDCYAETDNSETDACNDGIDNDQDGSTDFPDDSGCASAADHNEMSLPACADGNDNDGDSLVDFPLDTGCDSASDADEADPSEVPSTRSRVILAVATSGTLNSNTCGSAEFTGGDGSLECPGSDVACNALPPGCAGGAALTCDNGLPDDSRLFKVKHGASLAMLRGDVQFGLLQSRQRASEFACPTDLLSSQSGGWQGAGLFCEGGFDAGEVVVRVTEDNVESIQRYLDGESNMPELGLPPGHDFELRGSGAQRPLAGILTDAGDYIGELQSQDPHASCRPYKVVLVSDGAESCGGDAEASAATLAAMGASVEVVGFAVAEAGEITQLNGIAAAGNSDIGAAVLVDDAAGLTTILNSLLDEMALFERCNTLDDDCDGLVDEDFPRLGEGCHNGLLGVCAAAGLYECNGSGLGTQCSAPVISGSPEVCNQIDDDCDGAIDEEGVCTPTQELCNGLDDDGDMLVDEDFPVGANCSDGQPGICRSLGHYQCAADQTGVECVITAPGQPPLAQELCNALDDDCDGSVDEDSFGDMVQVTGGGSPFWIGKYEASRPDASAQDPGSLDHRACSRPGVQAWRLVNQAEAASACAAAGLRLCSADEWELACAGAGGDSYPYGDVYDPVACNGEDYDPGCTLPDEDSPLPAGSELGCPAATDTCRSSFGAYDMSGNLAEWTGEAVAPGVLAVRGGNFTDPGAALTCTFDAHPREQEFVSPSLGFRCCADQLPVPVLLRDGFESPGQ